MGFGDGGYGDGGYGEEQMAFSDAVDSYYAWVKGRILTRNPQRVVKGIFNAQDWPAKRIKYDAFYLLMVGEEPVGRAGWSPSTPIVFHLVQWVWVNKGTDLPTSGTRQANRGDRYRTAQAMKQELLFGLNPGYAPKLSWDMIGEDFVGTPKDPAEAITWTPARFHERYDKNSGETFATAAVRVQDMTDTITS